MQCHSIFPELFCLLKVWSIHGWLAKTIHLWKKQTSLSSETIWYPKSVWQKKGGPKTTCTMFFHHQATKGNLNKESKSLRDVLSEMHVASTPKHPGLHILEAVEQTSEWHPHRLTFERMDASSNGFWSPPLVNLEGFQLKKKWVQGACWLQQRAGCTPPEWGIQAARTDMSTDMTLTVAMVSVNIIYINFRPRSSYSRGTTWPPSKSPKQNLPTNSSRKECSPGVMPAAAPGSYKNTHQQTLHLNGKKNLYFRLSPMAVFFFSFFCGGGENSGVNKTAHNTSVLEGAMWHTINVVCNLLHHQLLVHLHSATTGSSSRRRPKGATWQTDGVGWTTLPNFKSAIWINLGLFW